MERNHIRITSYNVCYTKLLRTSWNTDQTVESQNLDCGQQYKFSIIVRDNANNSSERSVETGAVTDCYAPEMCIFEPEPGGLYSAASGLTVFVQPTEDDFTLAENEDVQSYNFV